MSFVIVKKNLFCVTENEVENRWFPHCKDHVQQILNLNYSHEAKQRDVNF